MPNSTNLPTVSTATSKRLPHGVERALADAFSLEHPDLAWTPPPRLPSASELRQAMKLLTPEPTRREHAMFCISKLALAFGEGKISPQVTVARAEVWLEACEDLGDELWTKATMALLRGWKRDDHYGRLPEPADFRDAVRLEFDERTKKIDRCRRMLEAMGDTTAKPVEKPLATRLERLRHTRGIFERMGDAAKVAQCEREIAIEEGGGQTPVWRSERATTPSTERQPFSPPTSRTAQRCAELARAHRMGTAPPQAQPAMGWQAGAQVYERTLEEPPMPDAIPEAMEFEA